MNLTDLVIEKMMEKDAGVITPKIVKESIARTPLNKMLQNLGINTTQHVNLRQLLHKGYDRAPEFSTWLTRNGIYDSRDWLKPVFSAQDRVQNTINNLKNGSKIVVNRKPLTIADLEPAVKRTIDINDNIRALVKLPRQLTGFTSRERRRLQGAIAAQNRMDKLHRLRDYIKANGRFLPVDGKSPEGLLKEIDKLMQ